MSDDVVRLSVIGQILRRRWQLLVVLAVLGGLLGFGAAQLLPPQYQATSRVLLQGSYTGDDTQVQTHVATSSTVLDRAAVALGWGVGGADLRGAVDATVVEENLIEIAGKAGTPARAQQLTDRVAAEYVRFSGQLVSGSTASAEALRDRREVLRQQIAETNDRITELHDAAMKGKLTLGEVQGRTELERLRGGLAEAATQLGEAEAAASQVNLVVIGPAALPSSPLPPTAPHLVAGGSMLFVVLGFFSQLVAMRRDRRLRDDSEIGAALGSPVLGGLDVPGTSATDDAATRPQGWWVRLRRLMHDGPPLGLEPLPVSRSDLDRRVRERRVLAQLRVARGSALRVLVVVAHDDEIAHRAVAQLALAAAAEAGPASVVTDRADLSHLLERGVRQAADDNVQLTVRPTSDPVPESDRTVIHVADVVPSRPTVPESLAVSGALAVLGSGSRTGWELVEIGQACAEAGYRVIGAVVAHQARLVDRGHHEDRPQETGQGSRHDRQVPGEAVAGSR